MRQIAEAVHFAHAQRLYHRALSPQSIYIDAQGRRQFSIKIGNWSTADRAFEAETQHLTVLSHMSCMIQEEAGPYLALEAHSQPTATASIWIFSRWVRSPTCCFQASLRRKPIWNCRTS